MSTPAQPAATRRPWGYSRFWRAVSVIVLRPSLRLLVRIRRRRRTAHRHDREHGQDDEKRERAHHHEEYRRRWKARAAQVKKRYGER